MARLLTFADRGPLDVEWKGAVVWKTILSLAETHHEVLALTTLPLETVESISHPRLTIASPAPDFAITRVARWMRAFLQFQPEIVHTFGLRAPPRFSCWPVLAQAVSAFPRLQHYSTVFSDSDFAPFERVSAPFDPEDFNARDIGSNEAAVEFDNCSRNFYIVPAPVSEWQKPLVDLLMLADFLENNPAINVCVVGGWGSFDLRERKQGWNLLGPLSARVQMLPDLRFEDFVALTRKSRGLWLRSVPYRSWRALVASHVADALSLPIIGTVAQLHSGSAANFLSRLYSNTYPSCD